MKNQSGIAIVIAAVGIIIGLVSLLADTIGIGTKDAFGTWQVLGTVLGLVVLGAGVAYYYYGDRLIGKSTQSGMTNSS